MIKAKWQKNCLTKVEFLINQVQDRKIIIVVGLEVIQLLLISINYSKNNSNKNCTKQNRNNKT